ncbi:mannose-6-phosphate isomerase, class I [Arthrobacter sp. KK5.5]|uniref:mannose-6-phosphate isomerase, class I n=1 Tax=Arthrobacter sp. KK5.5 TaxID=3373084 RepID=UPI003EE7B012
MHRLENSIRDYPWGSTTMLPGLLGTVPDGRPQAELWIGAHPDSPSVVRLPDGSGVPLDALVAADPGGTLGAAAAQRFGGLPFLTKLLAADEPLSLQVHPTLERARLGFAAEDAAGVPRGAAHRNYRDDNHKPEMIYALTPFTALSGFRDPGESAALFRSLATAIGSGSAAGTAALSATGAAERTAALLYGGDLRAAFTHLLDAGPDVVALVGQAAAAVSANPALGDDAGLAELPSLAEHHPGDPGVLVSLMLNHVTLDPGQAVYLPAGNVHAYLRGLGVEVMASSDNVLRGGLTGKHVDLPELLATVDFSHLPAPFLEPETTGLGQEVYRPPFEEFQLQRIHLPGGGPDAAGGAGMAGTDIPLVQNGPVVVLCVAGELLLDTPKGDERVGRGESFFVGANESPVIAKSLGTEPTLAFAVTLAE